VDFDARGRRLVDVQTIFHKMEQRTLAAAYRFYCDKPLDNAHSAAADTMATYEVLKAQLDRYEKLENNISFLGKFSTQNVQADLAGFIAYNEAGEEVFNFGKYKGKVVTRVFKEDTGYFAWMMNGEFPLYTKKILTEIKLRDAGLLKQQ
jgi:DNA polymerase-3 subunit epsilon